MCVRKRLGIQWRGNGSRNQRDAAVTPARNSGTRIVLEMMEASA